MNYIMLVRMLGTPGSSIVFSGIFASLCHGIPFQTPGAIFGSTDGIHVIINLVSNVMRMHLESTPVNPTASNTPSWK